MSNNNDKGLLDKKRQAKLANEWEKELRGLSREEGIKIFELVIPRGLAAGRFIVPAWEFRLPRPR